MARFECTWCGKYCRSFGEFIRVERQISARDYFCRYGITNELFPVHVLPEFAEAIEEDFEEISGGCCPAPQNGCLFMRKDPGGRGFACAIYPTRPAICREFICYRMLIYHRASGEVRGRVIGAGEIRTIDEALKTLWDGEIADLPYESHHAAVLHSHTPGIRGRSDTVQNTVYPGGRGKTSDPVWVAGVLSVLESHGYRGDPVE